MIKYDFEVSTKYGTYRDALHFPDDYAPTETELETLKQQRVNSWINIIENPVDTPQIFEE